MKNKKIIIAGGTGFIGQALAAYFGKDNHVVILSRQAIHTENNAFSKNVSAPMTDTILPTGDGTAGGWNHTGQERSTAATW